MPVLDRDFDVIGNLLVKRSEDGILALGGNREGNAIIRHEAAIRRGRQRRVRADAGASVRFPPDAAVCLERPQTIPSPQGNASILGL